MAAGLGYKEFTTGDVLTAADANGYLASQVVMVFANAAARTSAIASPQEGMISYLKDTNSTEYYSGSAWVAIGGASGSMTSIASGSLSGSTLSLTTISGSYKDLRLIFRDYFPSAGGDFLVTVNSVTDYTVLRSWTSDTSGTTATNSTNLVAGYAFVGGDSYVSGDNNNTFMMDFYDYADTTSSKLWRSLNKFKKTTPMQVAAGQGSINTTSAITSITVALSAGTFSGGTYILYGVN